MRFLIILFVPFILFSQENSQSKKFDSIFYDVAVNVSSSNSIKALHIADSLSIHAANKKQKIRSLMLVADILSKQEKRGEAIIQALEALEITKKEKDYIFEARIYGFLSTQYRIIGFMDKGKSFLTKGLQISNQITNKEQAVLIKAMGNHEMAEYAFEEKDYTKAIKYLKLTILSYEKEKKPEFKNFVIAGAEERLGRSYAALNNKEEALTHLYRANICIHKAGAGNTMWAGQIYQSLGDLFLENKNIDSTQVYLKKALTIANISSNGKLKEKVYKSMGSYYKTIQKLDSFAFYDAKYKTVLKENEYKEKAMVNAAYNALNSVPNKKWLTNANYAIVLTVLGGVFLGVYIKREKAKVTLLENTQRFNKNNTVDIVLSKKLEDELAYKLKEFEESNAFLDKNISLPKLLGELNTNTKYFRIFLKKNKNTDYINYINELRINYIKEKLLTDNDYLNYKISYLADECGFSSHSKFSATFKNIVGLSPSEFIGNINKSSLIL